MRLEQTDILSGIDKKKKLFEHYYDNFEKHLFEGRLSKASEFLWGSIHCLIYSLGLTYGKQLSRHKAVIDFIKELSEESNDEDLFKYFKISEELHMNFYHDTLDEEGLKIKREYADKLIKKLNELIEKRSQMIKSAFVEETPEEKTDFLPNDSDN